MSLQMTFTCDSEDCDSEHEVDKISDTHKGAHDNAYFAGWDVYGDHSDGKHYCPDCSRSGWFSLSEGSQ